MSDVSTPHSGRYATIVVDPPWPARTGFSLGNADYRGNRNGESHETRPPYPTLSIDEIAALPVSQLAEPQAHLYLWSTTRWLKTSYEIAKAWGFASAGTVLVWCKKRQAFVGGYFGANVEFILFFSRAIPTPNVVVSTRWFEWPKSKHSQKPEAFYDMVEQVSPGPYLELFARRQRLGWDTWGNEALEHVEIVT